MKPPRAHTSTRFVGTSISFDGLKTDRRDKVKGVYASDFAEMLTSSETDSHLSRPGR